VSVELEPVIIHIAKKWFQVPSTDRHQIVEGDGFLYVKERYENAPKFDFAFIDTSYDDDFHLVMSPVVIFAGHEFASNLRKHMNSNGCAVAVNTYTHHKELEKLLDAEKFRHDMLQVYRAYFATCFYAESGSNNVNFMAYFK
jgi:spermidine synthase